MPHHANAPVAPGCGLRAGIQGVAVQHFQQLGDHMDLPFVLGREHDGPEARVAGLEGDASVAPAAVVVLGTLLALVALDGVALAGLRVDIVAKLHEHRLALARAFDRCREEAPCAVGYRRFHGLADDLGDEHATSQRAFRANLRPLEVVRREVLRVAERACRGLEMDQRRSGDVAGSGVRRDDHRPERLDWGGLLLVLHPGRPQGLADRHPHRVVLMVARHLLGQLAPAVVLEDDEVADHVEQALRCAQPLDGDLQLGSRRLRLLVAVDGAPRLEPLPAAGERPESRFRAVRHAHDLVHGEERRQLHLVGLKLPPCGVDGGVAVAGVLELDHAQRESADE